MAEVNPIPAIWELPDDLWERIEGLLDEYDSPKATGRKRKEARRMLNGIIYRFRTGCQWNHIPKEFGDDSTIHRTFQRWVEKSALIRHICAGPQPTEPPKTTANFLTSAPWIHRSAPTRNCLIWDLLRLAALRSGFRSHRIRHLEILHQAQPDQVVPVENLMEYNHENHKTGNT